MKFAFCIVALTFIVSVKAVPAPLTPAIVAPTNEKDYFKQKLESIQGALKDTFEAGKDLQLMEDALKDIVAASSFFWRTESATEYATDKDAYANGWAPVVKKSWQAADRSCKNDDECISGNCYGSECALGLKTSGDDCDYDEECGRFLTCSHEKVCEKP